MSLHSERHPHKRANGRVHILDAEEPAVAQPCQNPALNQHDRIFDFCFILWIEWAHHPGIRRPSGMNRRTVVPCSMFGERAGIRMTPLSPGKGHRPPVRRFHLWQTRLAAATTSSTPGSARFSRLAA